MVQPVYPPQARADHVEGDVVLQLRLSKDGSVKEIKALRGDPALVESAKQAVAQWRYRPFLLNGKAVEAETQVFVKFRLSVKRRLASASKS
jgi:periplasmic protein TonB